MDASNGEHSNERCLIIILAQTRCHEKTFKNIKYNLIDKLNADLCLCVAEDKYASPSLFNTIAKYNFTITEPDDWGVNFDIMYKDIISKYPDRTDIPPWRDLLKIRNQWLGGIPDEHQHPGSAGILIYFRWFLMDLIEKHNFTKLYDRFIITRSDYIYTLPHPSLEYLDKNYIWIPYGEQYDGYTDRHVIISSKDIFSYLNIFETIILDKELQEIMKMNQNWNLEQIIKLNLLYHGLEERIRPFPYIMYTIKFNKEDTSWQKNTGHLHNGVFVKYIVEFERAVYYLNEYLTKYPLIKEEKNKNHYCKYGHFTNTFIPYDIDKFYYQQNVLDINWDTNQKYAYMLKNPQIYIIHVNSMRILYYLGVLSHYNNNISSSTTNYNTITDLDPPYKLKWHKIWGERLKKILIKHNFKDKKLQWVFGDIEEIQHKFALVKNRTYRCRTTIIYSLQIYDIEKFKTINDINFENKLNRVYWRGPTTGQPHRTANRFTLVKKYFNSNSDIDIGFSGIIQDKQSYNKYIKDWGGWQDFLHNKYIISVHGNDADVDLSWKLASNSVVLMAKPQYFTWFMEDLLIPGYHYILLKDDFSDLREKLDWCKANQDKCKEIIAHAHKYMEIFRDINVERDIEREVLRIYFEKTNINI
tara:strand:- start:1955 stop:3877 length:1923 start_codon:yes stop_codon:yes gene_type:complete